MRRPEVVVTYRCPDCGRAVYKRRRRRDGEPFLGCSGYPSCRWACDYDARVQALAEQVAELQAQGHVDSHGVSARDIRKVLTWAHPDRWPNGTLPVHEVAVRLSELFETAKGSA